MTVHTCIGPKTHEIKEHLGGKHVLTISRHAKINDGSQMTKLVMFRDTYQEIANVLCLL